jgi:hypothetical protein
MHRNRSLVLLFLRSLVVLVLGALLALGAVTAQGQSTARMQVLAFADSASVRIDVNVPDAAELAGAPVHAVITSIGDTIPLWSGDIGRLAVDSNGTGTLTERVEHLHPRLWSPASPNRYALTVTVTGQSADPRVTVRFGFRSFEVRDGRLFLNGRPIFLRGNAINPPGRTIPDSLDDDARFAADYVAYLKRIHVNMIRLSRTSQVWLDVCDSLGMMVYQGLYGTPKGGTKSRPPEEPFAQMVDDYHAVLEPLVNHPSVVVYVLANELASRDIIQSHAGADTIAAFLSRVHDAMRDWDPTRVYIANAGYGYGRSGDICDTHHYWGWYYNTVLSYYTLRDPHTCWRTARKQPMTISENTGSYTGPDGRFNIVSDSKQMSSQLDFTGHTPVREQVARAGAYQRFAVRNAIEIMRRTRSENPYLAGLMPFTTLFSRWWRIHSFADMTPSPAAEQYAISYQPVLLSWELWTPQVYAGTTLRPTAHVVNDDTLGRDLRDVVLHWQLVDSSGAVRLSGDKRIGAVAYFGAVGRQLSIALPSSLPEGTYVLEGRLVDEGREVSHNRATVFVASRGFAGTTGASERRVALFDPDGRTAAAFRTLGIAFTPVTSVATLRPDRDVLAIGAYAWSAALQGVALRRFVQAGGRVLVMEQDSARFDTSWLGARVHLLAGVVDAPGDRRPGNPFRNAMAVNPERPDHPLFNGLDRDRLFLWSDPAGWTEHTPGFPAVYPVTHGFVLENPEHDLEHVAILADYGRGLEGIGAAEIFDGKGSVLLTGFDLVSHVGVDPAADRLLVNAVRYEMSATSHFAHPLVRAPIEWGNYGTEAGLAIGIYDGLIVNTVPVVPEGLEARYPITIDKDGFHFAGGHGGWNSRPAIQYVAQGRRPFGPYHFDLFGSPRLPKDHDALGTGRFWMRVPAATSVMFTRVENPSDVVLPLELTVNGKTQREEILAGETVRIQTSLHGATDLAVMVRGDRRLVLRETAFR